VGDLFACQQKLEVPFPDNPSVFENTKASSFPNARGKPIT